MFFIPLDRVAIGFLVSGVLFGFGYHNYKKDTKKLNKKELKEKSRREKNLSDNLKKRYRKIDLVTDFGGMIQGVVIFVISLGALLWDLVWLITKLVDKFL
jgi:hypothetical protein